MSKLCISCNLDKPLTNFVKDKRRKDGYGSHCKPCSSKRLEKYRKKRKIVTCEICNTEFNPKSKDKVCGDTCRKEKRKKYYEEQGVKAKSVYKSKKDIGYYKCTGCHETKLVKFFYIHKNSPMGHSSRCKECTKKNVKKYTTENREKVLEKKRIKSKDRYKEGGYTREQRSIRNEQSRMWRLNNPDHVKKYNKQYKDENKALCKEIASRRRLQKLNAYPEWISRKELRNVYKGTPEGHHVDHIIPLVHPEVCGLHVPWNMQYLPCRENHSKNNKFDGTYENETWRSEVRFYDE